MGRACGSLARAASTSGRRPGGTALMSGSACMIRYMMASEGPVPNGAFPPAAKATVTAQVKMSAARPGAPGDLLGRNEAGRADRDARPGQAGRVQRLGDAEV